MDYFRKDEFMRAAIEANIHFVVCSSLNYGYTKWVTELIAEPKKFNNREEFVQAEKEFQKQVLKDKVPSMVEVAVEKKSISFKSATR
jgi:hypothetical protein